jgi:hypothetical protein
MANKAPAKKAPAKRKPRPKKPVDVVVPVVDTTDYGMPVEFPAWLVNGLKVISLIAIGSLGGIWVSGGIEVGPGPLPDDSVSAVFGTQESAFRSLSGERAKALRAGKIKSEADSAAWMSSRFIPKAEAAWIVLLTEEAKAFGGEQWTAEKEAAHIERYAR